MSGVHQLVFLQVSFGPLHKSKLNKLKLNFNDCTIETFFVLLALQLYVRTAYSRALTTGP